MNHRNRISTTHPTKAITSSNFNPNPKLTTNITPHLLNPAPQDTPCPIDPRTEAAAVAKDRIPEVDAEAVVEEAAREARSRSARDPRRRTFLTWASIWTSRLLSSLTAVARVCLVKLRAKESELLTSGLVKGTLKGYDALMNLVLDDVHEVVRGMTRDAYKPSLDPFLFVPCYVLAANTMTTDDEGNESTRSLGLVVVRGTLLVLVSPVDGSEEIANPFVQAEDD
jgi:small nuclear ribonucleoprotein (snRNP)-like protein